MMILHEKKGFGIWLAVLVVMIFTAEVDGQKIKVLHYTETSGFDHRTRGVSLDMFKNFENVIVVDDQTGMHFDDLDSLRTFDVVVFSNTSGDQILNNRQRENFEDYMMSGGGLLGIHAASDTYRHSSANGNKTGTWDFYAETLGGSVQQNPNHVRGTPYYLMHHLQTHTSLDGISNPWGKKEEYYYWENGYLDVENQIILEVEETLGPNNMVNSYDSARAVSWYKILPSGSRVFYTSLGHATNNFTTDTLFQRHIERAMRWCAAQTTSVDSKISHDLNLRYAHGQLVISHTTGWRQLQIVDIQGQVIWQKKGINTKTSLSADDWLPGVYVVFAQGEKHRFSQKFIVK